MALVIGNSAYQHARAPESRQRRDRAGDAATRRSRPSTLGRDLDGEAMRRALQRLFRPGARHADMALVYYAGHGIEVDGVNYLIPVDAKLERDLDVEDEARPARPRFAGRSSRRGGCGSSSSTPAATIRSCAR